MDGPRQGRQSIRIGADHPSLPGHFPGAPVVPGVVLLDRIAAALEHAGAGRLAYVGAVKFAAPLLPEQDAELSWTLDGVRVSFRIERAGSTILSGQGEVA
ncbi:hydroxymyristoyl-ACP dehydratase [Dokdonella sp.]|uniref:hydroxymyristoyl-ACP dehydratase n=1 Tax=Dokdonella sp. TaxID=2291710 RepID=UPI001AFE4BAD|nr:hydroxymyristoyl-ACP dehydratase [Dokdonella sp.]MBO9661818.1 hydroxymyristoyl-ACP dehydratase [Dokdonella sp.]